MEKGDYEDDGILTVVFNKDIRKNAPPPQIPRNTPLHMDLKPWRLRRFKDL